jgi:hypothetical protein
MLMGELIIPAKIHLDSVLYAHALLSGTYPQHIVEREANSVAGITMWMVRWSFVIGSGIFFMVC